MRDFLVGELVRALPRKDCKYPYDWDIKFSRNSSVLKCMTKVPICKSGTKAGKEVALVLHLLVNDDFTLTTLKLVPNSKHSYRFAGKDYKAAIGQVMSDIVPKWTRVFELSANFSVSSKWLDLSRKYLQT